MEILYDNSVCKAIKKLDPINGAKVDRTIHLLKAFGKDLRMPHSKKVAHKIFELRTKGQTKIRILYTFHDNSVFLLHLFIKKSQKIPPKEIETAQKKIEWIEKLSHISYN